MPAMWAAAVVMLCIGMIWLTVINTLTLQSAPALQGRFGGHLDSRTGLGVLPLVFSWPASSVFLTFTGDLVNATFTALPNTAISAAYNQLVFYVDHNQLDSRSTSPANTKIAWGAAGLGPGRNCFALRNHD